VVRHPLYDDTANITVPWALNQTDLTKNFRLYRYVMTAGQSAHLALTSDNTRLVGENFEFLVRLVHITVPSRGTLVLDTIPDDPSNTFWVLSDTDPPNLMQHVSISIDAATTIIVNVGVCDTDLCSGRSMTGGFTLKTAFAP
jgi:hypothetical protein